MDYIKEIERLLKKNNGTLVTSELTEKNIPRIYLAKMMKLDKIIKVKRGVYASPDAIEDEMYYMQKKYSRIIYSHETALYLLNLSDRTPFEYSITVPSSYKVVSNLREEMSIYYIKDDLHQLGAISYTNNFGNEIKIYNLERTICDLLRSRNRMDIEIINKTMKEYVSKKEANYKLLYDYSKKLNIEGVVRKYMELLL